MGDAEDFLSSFLLETGRLYTILEEHEVEDIYELKEKANVVLPIIWALHDEFALWMFDK